MTTVGTDTLDQAALQAVLGPHLTAEQAAMIFRQGEAAVVFALLTLAQRLAQRPPTPSSAPDPSAPSGQTPPYVKPTARERKGVRNRFGSQFLTPFRARRR
jgi:hypothetical protein